MKYKEFERLFQTLLPDLPGFRVKKYLIYRIPSPHILHGFCGEGSAYSKSDFTVWVFVLPLYVPAEVIYFNFGERIGWSEPPGEFAQWYEKEDPKAVDEIRRWMKTRALPLLSRVNTPAEFPEWLIEYRKERVRAIKIWEDAHDARAMAYSLVLSGRYAEAEMYFEKLALRGQQPGEPDWVYKVCNEAEQVWQALKRDPAEARAMLDGFEQQTKEMLTKEFKIMWQE
jgi:hypothetical protein